MLVEVGLPGALVVLGALAVLGTRRWAVRVERGPGDVPDKVHRLQRGLAGVLLGGLAVVVLLPVGLVVSSGGADEDVPLWVVPAPFVGSLVLLAGLSRAVRPSLVQLRGIEDKQSGRLRAVLVLGSVGGLAGGALVAVTHLVPGSGTGHAVGTVVAYLAVLLLVPALSAPAWLVALRAQPLPPDQRERLLDLARRLDVRVRDIRSFPGRGQKVANALQVGLLPRLRYVLVSDYLLDGMTERELDAVVAHELGHAREHHLLVKLLAWAATWGLMTGFGVFGPGDSSLPVAFALLAPVSLLLVQGLVGVRLERRADAAAARDVGPEHLADALDRLGELNDTKRRTGPVWNLLTQHPGLQQRVNALRSTPTTASS